MAVERGLPAHFSVGASFNSAGDVKEVGIGGSWMPMRWLSARASAGANVVDLGLPGTWINLALAGLTPGSSAYHLVAMPRLTTNTDDIYFSVGVGGKVRIWRDISLGAETEPVLFGPKDTTRFLAWNIALDKEVGWHNFTLIVGNAWHQNPPYWFARANRDVAMGHFRIGFNILRKL